MQSKLGKFWKRPRICIVVERHFVAGPAEIALRDCEIGDVATDARLVTRKSGDCLSPFAEVASVASCFVLISRVVKRRLLCYYG